MYEKVDKNRQQSVKKPALRDPGGPFGPEGAPEGRYVKKTKSAKNLNGSLKLVFKDLNKDKKKKIILFSPSAASFDQFKNFEIRGLYFNKIIKKYIH